MAPLTSTPLVTQTWELGRSWAGFTGNGDFIHEITLLQNKGNDDLRGFHGIFKGIYPPIIKRGN